MSTFLFFSSLKNKLELPDCTIYLIYIRESFKKSLTKSRRDKIKGKE